MVLFNLNELADDAGETTGNFMKNAARGAADFACGLYRDFPAAVVPNPINSFLRGAWDSLCGQRPVALPPPPAPPFTGGQCPTAYYLSGSATRKSDGVSFSVTSGSPFMGPGFRVGLSPGNTTWRAFNQANATIDLKVVLPGIGTTLCDSNQFTAPSIATVSRADGLPDTCGNPAPSFPGSSEIPPGRLTGNTTVEYNDGTDVTLPLVYAPITGNFPITVDVGGVKFDFTHEGVSTGRDLADAACEEAADCACDLKRLYEHDRKVRRNYAPTTEYLAGAFQPPSVQSGVAGFAFLIFELTAIPANAKMQFGNQGQNLLYAGWIEFTRSGACYERVPLSFARNCYPAPEGADGYSFTMYAGFQGRVSIVRRNPDS